jgi:hypothetical protein
MNEQKRLTDKRNLKTTACLQTIVMIAQLPLIGRSEYGSLKKNQC